MKKKRINKRVYALALAALLSASAVSCGNTYSSQPNETESKTAETVGEKETDSVLSTTGMQRTAVQASKSNTSSIQEIGNQLSDPVLPSSAEGERSGEAGIGESVEKQANGSNESIAEPANTFQAVSKAEGYVNVRNAPSTEGEVVGSVENGTVVTVLEQVEDWYRIQTDFAEGYCKAEFFVTGLTGVENPVKPTVVTAFCNASDYVNVRSTPNTDGDVVGIVYEGNAVTILETAGDWYQIQKDAMVGYSKAEFFTIAGSAAQPGSAALAAAVCNASDYVNMRSTPSTDGDVLGVVYEGSVVTVLEKVNDWYRVKVDETEGYVKAEYFEIQGSALTEETEAPTESETSGEDVQTTEPNSPSESEGQTTEPNSPSEGEGQSIEPNSPNENEGQSIEPNGTEGQTTEPNSPSEETQAAEPAAQSEEQEASIFDTIAVSRVSDYVNVRSIPSTDGEILGKIYDGCAATILEVVDDWYRIESGSVKGYIKAEFFVTGEEAEALAAELATEFGVVNTTTLRVRAEAALDSDCIDWVAGGSEFVVEEEKDGWGKIALDNTSKGWVSLEFLDTRIEFDTAISIEEERAKLEEQRLAAERAEEARRKANAAAAAARAASNSSPSSSSSPSSTPAPSNEPVERTSSISEYSSSLREAIVAYALQFVGNPYVYGGNSLTNGTDCSGFVKLIYAEFGYGLERRASYQYKYNGTQISIDQLRPGDLVFYGSGEVEHVGMYIGGGQIVHASNSRTGIIVANLYYRTPYGAVRIIND